MTTFVAKLFSIESWIILRLPGEVSQLLPSRGLTMVKGTINGIPFQSPLEPDGRGSHWMRVEDTLLKAAKAHVGDSVVVQIESTKEWPEPEVPEALQQALSNASAAVQALWNDITPMARWDWIRWIRATKNEETYKKHIAVTISKLSHGERRPCCFNRSICTVPEVSHNGVLRNI